MKTVSFKVKLFFSSVPPLVLMIFCIIFFNMRLKETMNQAEELYFDTLYQINTNLLSADRDFFQAFQASTKQFHMSTKGILDEETEKAIAADYTEKTAQVAEHVSNAVSIAEGQDRLLVGYKTEDGEDFSELYDKFETAYEKWQESFHPETGEGSYEESSGYFAEARSYLDGMQQITEKWAVEENRLLETKNQNIIRFSSTLFALLSIILVVIMFLVVRSIDKSIGIISRHMEILSQNDLSVEALPVYGKDEIGKMRKAFAQMQTGLVQIISTLQKTVGGLTDACSVMNHNTENAGSSMADINNAAMELATTVTHQAEDVDEIARNMNDLNSVMERNELTANSLNEASREINQVTENGTVIVERLTDINRQSLEIFQTIFDSIEHVRTSAVDIELALKEADVSMYRNKKTYYEQMKKN